MIAAADVSSATSVTVAGSHSHRTLRVREDGDGEMGIRIQSMELLK
jgi:hypothetical protein